MVYIKPSFTHTHTIIVEGLTKISVDSEAPRMNSYNGLSLKDSVCEVPALKKPKSEGRRSMWILVLLWNKEIPRVSLSLEEFILDYVVFLEP